MREFSYGFMKKLEHTTFEEALDRVFEALQSVGFGVLTEIDVKATMAEKLDKEFRRYVILGACNPPLAHEALEAEPHIGLLLPCNVVVQEGPEDAVLVSMADPKVMLTLVSNDALEPVAARANDLLRQAMARLG